jgi:hypothetical protein
MAFAGKKPSGTSCGAGKRPSSAAISDKDSS